MTINRAIQFNPKVYRHLLTKTFIQELTGANLLALSEDVNMSKWHVYKDGDFDLMNGETYICSFQIFKDGYRAIVARKFREGTKQ